MYGWPRDIYGLRRLKKYSFDYSQVWHQIKLFGNALQQGKRRGAL